MDNQFHRFGNPWAGDALWNIPVGGPYKSEVAFRFTATADVAVNRIRYFNTWSKERPGYHSGSGGAIAITLRKVYLGVTSSPIAVAGIVSPAASAKFPVLDFDCTVPLQEGGQYSIEFRNIHATPETEWCSVNTMAIMTAGDRQPNNSMEVLVRNSGQSQWAPFKPHLKSVTPIFTLYNRISPQLEDQIAFPGYGGMESWVREPRRIAGNEMIRQVFTPVRDVAVRNVAIRLARTGNPYPLRAELTRGLSQISISNLQPAGVPVIDEKTAPPSRIGHGWVVLPFPKPVTLTAGMEHRITFTAPAGDAYEAFPLRDGAEFGFCPPWPNSSAEFTTTGAGGWRQWDAWGKPSNRGDLQLYFNA